MSEARTAEHDPTCSQGGPSPARSAGAADKAHHLARAPPWTRSRHRAPGTGASTGGSEPTGHDAAAGRTRGIRPPARPRPHGKNDQTTIKTRATRLIGVPVNDG